MGLTSRRPSSALPRISPPLLALTTLTLLATGTVALSASVTTDRRALSLPTAEIAPGVHKPLLSLGTGGGMYGDRPVVQKAVSTWLSLSEPGAVTGVDTAIDYGNDDLVGAALAASDTPRRGVFLTTKQPGPIGYNETVEALSQALVRLQTTYVDLYLIHFPNPRPPGKQGDGRKPRQETWRGMEEVLYREWTRSIGVSNYDISDLEDTLAVATVRPALNQVLWNPASHDDALLEFCRGEGVALEAWSPLGGHDARHGHVLDLPAMERVAEDHGVGTAQVALRWTIQHGMTLAIGTTKEEHMEADLDVFGFHLTDDEVASISEIQNRTWTMPGSMSTMRP